MRVKDILTQAPECEQSHLLIKEESIQNTLHLHLLFLKTSEEDPGKDIEFLFSNFLSEHLFQSIVVCVRDTTTFTFILLD